MAINIFSGSGSKNSGGGKVNSASKSDRAKAAKSALTTPSETSNSGSTAVGTQSTLSKVGKVVGNVAGIASKFLPGLGGTIAKGISNIFNDPEWWQSVPGDAITLNEPLALVESSVVEGVKFRNHRPAILNIASCGALNLFPIEPTEQQITQYLMPAIRKVVNAITLQDATAYQTALKAGATLYASWRQLKKYDYLLKHGQTYIANLNDPAFPLFQVKNAAWLQTTINRLEEYLRSNIRLPHTLCEYLAWRYGRVYKSNDSAKSALVIYDVQPISWDPSAWDVYLQSLMNAISNSPEAQKANADIYNAYYDHDYMVEVRDDTQFVFDRKEFMLRLNLQKVPGATGSTGSRAPEVVAIDSHLDNPTAFMASTVSMVGGNTIGQTDWLFPVYTDPAVYVPAPLRSNGQQADGVSIQVPYAATFTTLPLYIQTSFVSAGTTEGTVVVQAANGSKWLYNVIESDKIFFPTNDTPGSLDALATVLLGIIGNMTRAKAVDYYNHGLYIPIRLVGDAPSATRDQLDISGLSIDAGLPIPSTIATEHIYAFANLVHIDRKTSMSYKAAEKLVARDTANLIESLDVAAAKS